MKSVTVRFDPTFSSKDYHYLCPYDGVIAGDKVIVDSPTNGYVVVLVVAVMEGEHPSATKRIVSIVDDEDYKRYQVNKKREAEIRKELEGIQKKVIGDKVFEHLAKLDPRAAELVKELQKLDA
jgi:hypothetical protein